MAKKHKHTPSLAETEEDTRTIVFELELRGLYADFYKGLCRLASCIMVRPKSWAYSSEWKGVYNSLVLFVLAYAAELPPFLRSRHITVRDLERLFGTSDPGINEILGKWRTTKALYEKK